MSSPAAAAPGGAHPSETADEIITRLRMEPIPEEGAWFVAGPRTQGLNGITVLLTPHPDGFSAMHRLSVDEGWQWLAGAPAALLRLRRGGSGVLNYVGAERPQVLVRRTTWMGASTLGEWTLLSCWCAPAFRPEHFELGDRAALTERYPEFATEIAALTRDEPVGRMR
jgi:predicted cupin superfamily sugar epimerase